MSIFDHSIKHHIQLGFISISTGFFLIVIDIICNTKKFSLLKHCVKHAKITHEGSFEGFWGACKVIQPEHPCYGWQLRLTETKWKKSYQANYKRPVS